MDSAICYAAGRHRLKKAGATVDVVSLAGGEIKGWDQKDWGRPVKVDKTLDEASASDYDAIDRAVGSQRRCVATGAACPRRNRS